jgi:hypothetical protein
VACTPRSALSMSQLSAPPTAYQLRGLRPPGGVAVCHQRRCALLAARRGSAAPAGGRGSSPCGGWPWLASAGTRGSAAPDGSGAAPGAGDAWTAAHWRAASPPAGRVRLADGASRHAVRCAHSHRYARQRSSRRTGQRGPSEQPRQRAGLPPLHAGLPATAWKQGVYPLHPRARASLAGRRTREQR